MVLAPAILLVEAAVVALSPLLALVAALLGPFTGGRRPLRVVAIAVDYAARHLGCTARCVRLWLASGFGRHAHRRPVQDAHHDVLRRFVGGLHGSMTRVGRVGVHVIASEAAQEVLSARRRPVVVLSRHAGEGDSLLVLEELLRHGRRPRVVLHEALRLDPLIDVLGRRLPHRFVDPRGGDTEKEIAAMAHGLPDDGAVLIFPEGGNFTAARRRRGIERLTGAGHHEEAAWADEMQHVTAPRPGGALAAIEAVPRADVVFVGHVGVPVGLREVWRGLPLAQTVELRLWVVPAEAIPAGVDERIDWLFGWWGTIDDWIGERVGA